MNGLDLTWLKLPVWVLTTAGVSVAVLRGAFWIKSARFNGNGQTGQHSATESVHMSTVATALNSASVSLAQIAERLSNVPTKLEFEKAVTEIRHDTRNIVGGVQAGLAVEIRQARDQVLGAIEGAAGGAA